MNRLRPRALRYPDQLLDVQVTLARRRRPEDGKTHPPAARAKTPGPRPSTLRRSRYPSPRSAADYANRDLPAVGDQYLPEHLALTFPAGIRPRRALQLHPRRQHPLQPPRKLPAARTRTWHGLSWTFLLQHFQRRRYRGRFFKSRSGFDPQSGMFPCLREGRSGRFVRIICSAFMRYGRVSRGSITSSMNPISAATIGLLNCSS